MKESTLFTLFFVFLISLLVPTSGLEANDGLKKMQAEEKINQGEKLIRAGEWLVKQEISAFDPNQDIEKVHAQGRDQIRRGKELIREGEAILAKLEQKNMPQSTEPIETNFNSLRAPLDKDSLDTLAKGLLEQLWAREYSQNHVNHIYISEKGIFYLKTTLEGRFGGALLGADKGRYTIKVAKDLYLQQEGDDTVFVLPGGKRIPKEKKASIIYGELVLSDQSANCILSLRAIDAHTREIIAVETISAPYNEELEADVGVKKVSDSERLPENITLIDTANFIPKVEGPTSQFVFALNVEADPSALVARSLPVLLKKIMAVDLNVRLLDDDFIVLAFSRENGSSVTNFKSTATATWKIEPRAADQPNLFIISGVGSDPGRAIEVGTLSITSGF